MNCSQKMKADGAVRPAVYRKLQTSQAGSAQEDVQSQNGLLQTFILWKQVCKVDLEPFITEGKK